MKGGSNMNEENIQKDNELEQVIDAEYDEEMVKEDLKAQEENNEELLVQDTFNEDSPEDMLGEGAEIVND